jgi:hypothetical protein
VDGFQTEPESLRTAGRDLTGVADQIDEIWQQFVAQVQGMGDIFGDDMVGGLIGTSHEAAMEVADDCMNSVIDGFADFGDGLLDMADSYEQTESGATDLMKGFLS